MVDASTIISKLKVMTQAELEAKLDIVSTQLTDLIQMVAIKMLGVNKGKNIALTTGSTPVVFDFTYDTGVIWQFSRINAVNADGFDVEVTISNEAQSGFTATVTEDCTFSYVALSFSNWITD